MKITINGVDITLKFRYSFLRALAELWKLDDVEAVFQKALASFNEFLLQFEGLDLEAIETKTDIKIPFSTIALFVDFVKAAALPGALNGVDDDDIAEHIIQNPNIMREVLPLFMASLPKPKKTEDEGKQELAEQPENPNP